MGIFSSIQKFHAAGEEQHRSSVEQYGRAARSLYTEAKLASLHQQVDVTDDAGQIVYQTSSKIVSIRGKTDVMDAAGNLVAHIEKKPISLHEKHIVTMADGRQFTLSNQLFHIVKDITDIPELGWQIQGNVMGLNFTLLDQNDDPVAVIGHKMISLHDRYSMDIYQPQHERIVVAVVIALRKMLNDRRDNLASSSHSDYDN